MTTNGWQYGSKAGQEAGFATKDNNKEVGNSIRKLGTQSGSWELNQEVGNSISKLGTQSGSWELNQKVGDTIRKSARQQESWELNQEVGDTIRKSARQQESWELKQEVGKTTKQRLHPLEQRKQEKLKCTKHTHIFQTPPICWSSLYTASTQ